MNSNYAYLIGVLGLGVVFAALWLVRPGFRRVMTYSGLFYLLYGFIIFLAIKLLAAGPSQSINPGYWTPPSLFDLNSRTGGYGLEDALFSFFAGGLTVGFYELIFKTRISKKKSPCLRKGHALFFALVFSSGLFVFTSLNAIYYFILLQSVGAGLIVWRRNDLLKNALAGGLFFMALYGFLFVVFKLLFPSFIDSYYHLHNTSRLAVYGIPFEEFLYALTLGMMWTPVYEYEFRLKDLNRSKKPRLAAIRALKAVR